MPFELGRPFGATDPTFQKEVVLAALRLLEEPNGPVIWDFPQEAPQKDDEAVVLSCPLPLAGKEISVDETERICDELRRELAGMRAWYELWLEKRKRTTVGVSGLALERIGDFITAFVRGEIPDNPRDDISLPFTLKLVVDDLKAYYQEALLAQPGNADLSAGQLLDWFWGETAAAKALYAIRDMCKKSDDAMLKVVGKGLIVPSVKYKPGS